MAEYDEQCHWCGKVLTGPHKDQIEAPGGDPGHSYTHRTCSDCARAAKGRAAAHEIRTLTAGNRPAQQERQQEEAAIESRTRYKVANTRERHRMKRTAAFDRLMRDIRKKPGE